MGKAYEFGRVMSIFMNISHGSQDEIEIKLGDIDAVQPFLDRKMGLTSGGILSDSLVGNYAVTQIDRDGNFIVLGTKLFFTSREYALDFCNGLSLVKQSIESIGNRLVVLTAHDLVLDPIQNAIKDEEVKVASGLLREYMNEKGGTHSKAVESVGVGKYRGNEKVGKYYGIVPPIEMDPQKRN